MRRRRRARGPATNAAASIELSSLPGARRVAVPASITPQLATLAASPPRGTDWLHEIKFDGYRMLARVAEGGIRLMTRNGNDWTDKFPALVAALAETGLRSAFLDGEIVHLGETGASSFSALQADLSEGRSDRLTYFVFDLLALDGYVLTDCRLDDRKRILQSVLAAAPQGAIRYSEHIVGNGPAFLAKACGASLEGIVSKRRDEPYLPGRSRAWIKIKCTGREEFVVLGWTEPSGSRRYLGSLLLGYYDADGQLHYAGRVGTGFSDRTLRELHERLVPLERRASPLAEPAAGIPRPSHWVEPELVAEIRFAEWTRDRRLRQPSFLGLRQDKTAAQVILDPRAGTALPPIS
jgi:bifunctional non-homologous end joining protein LigD